ncbi:MAG: cytochrome c [Candidatus Sulfotelmatobacter sp.]
MKTGIAVLVRTLAFAALVFFPIVLIPLAHAGGPSANKEATVSSIVHSDNADAMRVQGELRYRANCGRCHAAPRKFPPRMMATVLRHMRVRATITDEDMKLVLFYMTQ